MKWKSAAAVALAVIALAACGSDPSSSDAEVVSTGAPSQGVEPESGTNIDNFVAKTVSGESFVLSNALAQKPVVLWFWAPG